MICPQCQYEFERPESRCPECGLKIIRRISGMIKTSTVVIGTSKENSFYRSVNDVPEPMRRRLLETTNGENSATIVIADRAGKEQWTEIVAQRESTEPQHPAVEPEPSAPERRRGIAGLSWAAWAGVLLFVAAAAMIGAVFQAFGK